MISERKRLIFTAVVVSVVGIVTGLFLGGNLLPSQAAPQQYDEKTTTSKTDLSIIHAHDNISQHEHLVTIVTTTTETTPHGTFHDFAAAGTAQGTTTAPAASAKKQPANEIWITSMEFKPSSLTVPVGTKVTWVNKEGENHTVTSSKKGLFDGGLEPFGTFSFTFTEPGDYEYFCSPHEAMIGVIHVK